MSTPAEESELPEAVLRPVRRTWPFWLIPAAALLLCGWLAYRSWLERGLLVRVQLDQGYGLKAGAEVRFRGTLVGQVREVQLGEALDHVELTVALRERGDQLARAGARFWVVRPQVSLTSIGGLETVVGPRYLAVLPGGGAPQRSFVGLSEPPVVESIEPGDLEIVLHAPRRGSLNRGAPLLYRQLPVGVVLSVGLTSDSGAVEGRIHVPREYAALIRLETRFWNVGGIETQVGLKGITIEMESLQALLAGGIALATPPHAAEPVRNGHRFALADGAEREWLTWQPLVAMGSAYLPPDAVLPRPQRAVLAWKQGRWLRSNRSRRGWVIATRIGLIGPRDLLEPGEKADRESVVLEVRGHSLALTSESGTATTTPAATAPTAPRARLARRTLDIGDGAPPFSPLRSAEAPEDCLIVADPTTPPLPLAAARVTPQNGAWRIDPALPLGESHHGAAVVARSDGALIGIVCVEENIARVALLPSAWTGTSP